MLFLTLLQIPDASVWQHLADNGTTFLILGVAVYVLWRRDSVMNDKMNKYLDEDRGRMLDCINKNTESFNHLRDTMEDIAKKLSK